MKSICEKIIVMLLIIMVLGMNTSMAVNQSDINSQKNQQSDNQKKINDAEKEKEEIEKKKSDTQKEVDNLSNQISTYESQINELDDKITSANNKINEAQNKINVAEDNYNKKQTALEKRLVAVYEAGETSYLDVLLNSQSLTEFLSKYYIVTEVAEHDVELMNEIQKQKEAIENSKREIENSKRELESAKASKQGVTVQLKSAKSEKKAKVAELSEEEKKVQEQIEELKQDNIQIDQKIKALQAQMAAEANRNKQNSSGSSNSSTSVSTPSAAGFIKPVNSYITTGLYYSSGSYHGAVDYGAIGINGFPVFAVADGVVAVAEALTTSYGNYIIIYHPSSNLYTLYAHGQSGSICVSPGQSVKQGQQIMRVGSTGNSTGPHLHFEVRTSPGYYSNRVDPRAYLP